MLSHVAENVLRTRRVLVQTNICGQQLHAVEPHSPVRAVAAESSLVLVGSVHQQEKAAFAGPISMRAPSKFTTQRRCNATRRCCACVVSRIPQHAWSRCGTSRFATLSPSAAASSSAEGAPQVANASPTSTSDKHSTGSNSGNSKSNSGPSTSGSSSSSTLSAWLQSKPAMARKMLSAESAAEAAEVLLEEGPNAALTADDCELFSQAALERGNVKLAMSVHNSMEQARRGIAHRSVDGAFSWPAATLHSTTSLVLALCKQLAIDQALQVLSEIRVQGLPRNDEVGFGKVITSPLAPGQTLTVVQPQEGCKLVADAFSRYEYEVFSGRVLTVKSEALQPTTGLLYAALRAVGVLRRPAPAAVHEFTVQAPDGASRTFRVATPTADVPAQKGERVTFVCAPSTAMARAPTRKRQQGLLSSDPPDTKPGEAMTATNHNTGIVSTLLPPPLSNTQATLPSWVLPVAVLAAGGDAASSLIDPSLPTLITAVAVTSVGAVVAGNQVLIPKLKQLPEKSVSVEYTRQRLLGQYAQLASKSEVVMAESKEDVRMLARLWQLQNKMQSVGSGAAGSYAARMDRVALARSGLEERLVKKVELLDGYSRVMNMIEIEVEMDIEVPAAELAGIEQQMVRLTELEGLQDEWKLQAEARDEVERLLRIV